MANTGLGGLTAKDAASCGEPAAGCLSGDRAAAVVAAAGFGRSAGRGFVVGRGGVVAYISRWSTERDRPAVVVARGRRGIGFADETAADRDARGVLWERTVSRPGVGRPQYERVHPVRQRRAMRDLLCQVCAHPADRNDRGVLWLLRDHRDDWPDWPEHMANTYPPLCLPCARASVRACPALRRGCVAVRAHSHVAGVFGTLYRPGAGGPVRAGAATVAYDDPAARWMLAAQLVRSLSACTIVTLDTDTGDCPALTGKLR